MYLQLEGLICEPSNVLVELLHRSCLHICMKEISVLVPSCTQCTRKSVIIS
jgi:hypothetical protein